MSATNSASDAQQSISPAVQVANGSLREIIGENFVDSQVAEVASKQLMQLEDNNLSYPSLLLLNRKVVDGAAKQLEVSKKKGGSSTLLKPFHRALSSASPAHAKPLLDEAKHTIMNILNDWCDGSDTAYLITRDLTPDIMFGDTRLKQLNTLCSLRKILYDTLSNVCKNTHSSYTHLRAFDKETLSLMGDWVLQGAAQGLVDWRRFSHWRQTKLEQAQKTACSELAEALNPFYHSGLNHEQAKQLLKDAKIGNYVVGDSSTHTGHLSLSVKVAAGNIQHLVFKPGRSFNIEKALAAGAKAYPGISFEGIINPTHSKNH